MTAPVSGRSPRRQAARNGGLSEHRCAWRALGSARPQYGAFFEPVARAACPVQLPKQYGLLSEPLQPHM